MFFVVQHRWALISCQTQTITRQIHGHVVTSVQARAKHQPYGLGILFGAKVEANFTHQDSWTAASSLLISKQAVADKVASSIESSLLASSSQCCLSVTNKKGKDQMSMDVQFDCSLDEAK